ncbi:MAG: hypothetical protein ABSB36_03190 [Candidatus Dormibacteria bacterium]
MSAEQLDAVAQPAPARPAAGAVRVAEVTAESAIGELPELPLHLAGEPGTVAVQLRTTVRRVAVGAGLARKLDLLAAVRALPGLPGLATSPAGGTFVIGGPGWMGLCAVGVPPPERGMPLDWMNDSLGAWFRTALAGFGVSAATGRVEGGWCPGFSDVAVAGRKLIGLGYRVTRDWVVMRGMMAVAPIAEDDMDLLIACHRLIGVEVVPAANTSLAEAAGRPGLGVDEVIERWRDVRTTAG